MTATTTVPAGVLAVSRAVIDQPESAESMFPGRTIDRQTRAWLRVEGLVVGIVGAVVFSRLGGDWLWFVPALLLVDLSAIGYLAGPRTGATTYDIAHNWAVGFAIVGLGLAVGIPVVALTGTVLVAHTGLDRALGYGLKLQTGFKDTHLGRIGR